MCERRISEKTIRHGEYPPPVTRATVKRNEALPTVYCYWSPAPPPITGIEIPSWLKRDADLSYREMFHGNRLQIRAQRGVREEALANAEVWDAHIPSTSCTATEESECADIRGAAPTQLPGLKLPVRSQEVQEWSTLPIARRIGDNVGEIWNV